MAGIDFGAKGHPKFGHPKLASARLALWRSAGKV